MSGSLLRQHFKFTFSKSCLLATFNCKMVPIKKIQLAKKTLKGRTLRDILHEGLMSWTSRLYTGGPSSCCEELLFFKKKIFMRTFSLRNEISWHSYRRHLLLHNDLKRNVTLAFQHVEVLCYNGLNLQRFVWGKMLTGILAKILIFFQ